MKPLTEKQVDKYLTRFTEWSTNKKHTEISQSFKTKTFLGGLSFIAKVTVHAELLDHHPTIELTYDKVTITLSTQDAKGLTRADFELARRIDNLKLC